MKANQLLRGGTMTGLTITMDESDFVDLASLIA